MSMGVHPMITMANYPVISTAAHPRRGSELGINRMGWDRSRWKVMSKFLWQKNDSHKLEEKRR